LTDMFVYRVCLPFREADIALLMDGIESADDEHYYLEPKSQGLPVSLVDPVCGISGSYRSSQTRQLDVYRIHSSVLSRQYEIRPNDHWPGRSFIGCVSKSRVVKQSGLGFSLPGLALARWDWYKTLQCPIMDTHQFDHFRNDLMRHLAMALNYTICTSEYAQEVLDATCNLAQMYRDPTLESSQLYDHCIDLMLCRQVTCVDESHRKEIDWLLEQLCA